MDKLHIYIKLCYGQVVDIDDACSFAISQICKLFFPIKKNIKGLPSYADDDDMIIMYVYVYIVIYLYKKFALN